MLCVSKEMSYLKVSLGEGLRGSISSLWLIGLAVLSRRLEVYATYFPLDPEYPSTKAPPQKSVRSIWLARAGILLSANRRATANDTRSDNSSSG